MFRVVTHILGVLEFECLCSLCVYVSGGFSISDWRVCD